MPNQNLEGHSFSLSVEGVDDNKTVSNIVADSYLYMLEDSINGVHTLPHDYCDVDIQCKVTDMKNDNDRYFLLVNIVISQHFLHKYSPHNGNTNKTTPNTTLASI